MDAAALEERSRKLQERLNNIKSKPLVAVRLDLIERIAKDLDENPELKQIFGDPVSHSLALVFDTSDNSILVADEKIEGVDEVAELRFLKLLHEVMEKETAEEQRLLENDTRG